MAIAALRNNNPFDVSLPIAGWNGGGDTVGVQGQPGFGAFPDMNTGYQAGVQRLNSYITGQNSHGAKRTIKELNSVYATDPNWSAGVATHSGLDPNSQLDPNNADQMKQLQYGVLAQEMGQKNAAQIFAQHHGNDALAAINGAAGIQRPQGGPALSFSGDDDDDAPTAATAATATPAAGRPTNGTLSFGSGNNDGSGKKDNRFGLGDLFGASDDTKEKMHGIGARLVRAAAALSAGVNPGQSAQFNALGKSLEEQNKTDFQYMMGPQGQLIKINKDTGAASFSTLPSGGKGEWVAVGKDANGIPTHLVNKNTSEVKPFGGQQGQPANGPYGVPATETNPLGLPDNIDDLKASGKAGESLANQIEGVHRGDIAYPAGGSRMTPDQQRLKAGLGLYHPDMNANDFNARKKFRETIANTAGNSRGAQYASYNHSLDLLSQSADNVEKMGNSDNAYIPVGMQQMYNNARNQQNSPDKSGAAKNIDTSLVPALMGEQSKLYYGSNGGGQEERRTIGKSLTSGDTMTNQIAGLKTIRDQLTARGAVLEGEADKAYGKGAEAYYPTNDAGRKSLAKLNATIARMEDKQAGIKSAAPAAQSAAPTFHNSWDDAQKAGWK